MKKLIFVLAMFVIATPAFAALTITVTSPSTGLLDVKYAGADVNNLPRAFALDLTVGSPGTFTAISNYFVGESNETKRGYGIYPARITFDANDDVNNWGNPLANSSDPGAGTGLSSNHIVLEFASLYVDNNAPAASGTLCRLNYNCNSSTVALTVTMVDEETYRGGVVLEDGTQVQVNSTVGICAVDCFPSSFTTFAAWTTMGKPSCWCNTANQATATGNWQCDGDADTVDSGSPFKYRIYSGDLAQVITYWKKKITDYPTNLNPCADVDHKDSGSPFKYRVYSNDLAKIITNWKKKNSNLLGNCGTLARPE